MTIFVSIFLGGRSEICTHMGTTVVAQKTFTSRIRQNLRMIHVDSLRNLKKVPCMVNPPPFWFSTFMTELRTQNLKLKSFI